MSLDSTFWIDTRETPARVQAILAESGHFAIGPDIKIGKQVFADGAIVAISRARLFADQRAALGIDPQLQLYFGCADNSKTAAWTTNTVIGVTTLLRLMPGDALFVYSSQSPALLRKGGRLILDRRAGLWGEGVVPRVLPLVDLPYEFGEIPLVL